MKKSFLSKLGSGIAAHKFWSAVILVVVAGGGLYWYRTASRANAEPQYMVSPAHMGTLQQTVTGTGQVSASNQTDIQSQVSGTITSINAHVGQEVRAGELIATIDSTNAKIALDNAKLSLAKLLEPAKATDMSNAENTVAKAYNDAFDAVSTAYLDLPTIVAGMKGLYYTQGGFLSDAQIGSLPSTAITLRNQAGATYDAAVAEYTNSLAEFKNLTRSSSRADLDKMFADTYATMKDMANALSKTQTTITYITTNIPGYYSKDASTATTNVTSWSTTANNDVSAIVAAQNSITTSQNSLTTLVNGSDQLDIQAAQLAVDQAQRTYDNYFIRAPYDGIIGRIPVSLYGQAGASTVMATIVGDQKIAGVSLNEVDAAKVKSGQPVEITFDAIDGLSATGTVETIDQVGTVTQGVVSYGVKILINTADPRIKPGMSVNVTIITNQEDNVLLVPSSAVKAQGSVKYVQVLDQATVVNALRATAAANGQTFATGTRQFGNGGTNGTTTREFGSTTPSFSSTTRQFNGSGAGGQFGGAGQTRSFSITTSVVPQQVIVTTGDSDDTNTVILSGLNRGEFVITRTISSGTSASQSAPSILSSFGARGGAANGGANRGGPVLRAGGGG